MKRGAILAALLLPTAVASAEPLRLRGDALVQALEPTGAVALTGEWSPENWVRAEALIWGSANDMTGGDDNDADALVALVRVRHPGGLGEARLGRMVLATGAVRAVHLDGAAGLLRAPWGTHVEAFGGVPVTFENKGRTNDWLFGGRLSQRILSYGRLGVSYVQQLDDGDPANQEVGADITITPAEAIDSTSRASFDLLESGFSEVLVGAGFTWGPVRVDAIGSHRSPTRLLPATSLFTVLGEIAAQQGDLRLRWRAAPRLDIVARGGARYVDGFSEQGSLRTVLRLDERGAGAVSLQVRRDGVEGEKWLGLRGTFRYPIAKTLRLATEVEVVLPDEEQGRGSIWPWGLIGLGWYPGSWEVAAAFEASASPERKYALDGILRVGYRWAGP